MTWRRELRRALDLTAALPRAGLSRMLTRSRRAPRFAGAFATRERAAASCDGVRGYDDEETAGVSFDVMCRRAIWDYPVLFWLDRLLPANPSVLDAGGHLGTKYIAFSDLLDFGSVDWTVYDLPANVRVARRRQADGDLSAALGFVDRDGVVPPADILLCSGLLQYLDEPFAGFVSSLPRPPRYILLNKIAVREGPGVFTIERIGRSRVVYQIRNRRKWDAEIARMGYRVMDRWTVPDLGHVIPTHPWLGRSESCGYLLERRSHG